MAIHKNNALLLVAVAAVFSLVYFGGFLTSDDTKPTSDVINDLESSTVESSFPSPQTGQGTTGSPLPSPTPDTSKYESSLNRLVPWELLLGDASCKLQGEIRFLNLNTYDHQDAKFIYAGIDDVARNIFWTVTPEDELAVGPNLFANGVSLPNGESLLSITLPENPKSKTYELTAKIQYGRLVDENGKFVAAGGNVKVFEKQCEGKTTIVLP